MNDVMGDPLRQDQAEHYHGKHDLKILRTFLLRDTGLGVHDDGRERRLRIRQITYKLMNEPARAIAIMGMRIASA